MVYLPPQGTNQTQDNNNEDTSWALSMAAGVPSGIFKIFEGVATLGATLLDLGVDEDRAEAVEQYFADINPFDELAEATAIGKITELIVNIGVPGGAAFKIASGLGKATTRAQKAGKYIKTPEKLRRFGQGSLGAGAAEGVFVGDVEDAGTFGNFLGGPTELNMEKEGDPQAELLNRLKFGIEGAAFTGAFGAAGKLVGKMRKSGGDNKAVKGTFNKGVDRLASWMRSRGILPQEGFDIKMQKIGAESKDTLAAETAMRDIDKIADRITKSYKKVAVDKVTPETRNEILKEMNDVLMSGIGTRELNPLGKKLYSAYKKASFDPVSKKATHKSEQAFMKDIMAGNQLPLVIDMKAGPVLRKTFKDGALNKKKFTTFYNKENKIRPIFGAVDEFKVNKKTGRPGTTKEFKTKKQLYNVDIGQMNPQKVAALRKLLKNKYKTDDKDIDILLNRFSTMRGKWGELFTSMGRRFNPEGLQKFEELLPKYINDVLDRGYNVFKNNSSQWTTAQNYRPTKEIIKQAVIDFKNVVSKKIDPETGKKIILSDDLAEEMVHEVWKGASLPKGFLLGEGQGQVRFRNIPDFMLKSLADEVTQKNVMLRSGTKGSESNLSELSGVAKPIIQKLLGKAKNPMSSIVEGTNNLSAQVRSNEFFDNLIVKNNKITKVYDDWLKSGKVGPEPRVPFLFNNTGEARKYAGGTGDDYVMIGGKNKEAAQNIKLDKWTDPKGTLKEIDTTKRIQLEAAEEIDEIINPLNGKVALKDYAESFMQSQISAKSIPTQIYNNLILYPKGMSQMAKTILAPFTHVRNFLSASAFAAANGIMPFGNLKDVKAAYKALQVAGPGTRQSNQFYQELLDLGVVNSQVQLGDLRKLLEDVDFGSTLNNLNSDYGLNKLLKKLSVYKKFAQDAYTAEDDFWKIFTFLGEKSRLDRSYKNAGLRLGQEFTDMNGVKQIFNDEYLKIEAANLVKNTVPNYAFVSDFVRGIRKLPVGNFVAFPAEIIRTSANIVETALKEINYKTIINGKEVNPLRKRGLQRLTGMALTTTALPLGTVAAAQAVYNIADEEIDAMRRYVADWSKNSVLVPFKDKEGNLSYIDFSHLNAYDTVTRPIQTILNAVNEGRSDEDGLIDDFVLGLIESTKEIGSPFISESIWTEALQDVSPILGRGGRDIEGRKIWNDKDSLGDKMFKGIYHLAESQAPLNWNQLKRLGLSSVAKIAPKSISKFDQRGNEYELGNELLGIAGLRRVEVDPSKSFNYKITEYKTGIRDSRTLFTAATLKGGPVTPEEIIDAYINSNRALYNVNREMYKDIEAAKILGMSEDSLDENMVNRGERRSFNSLIEGEFRPLTISREVQDLFDIKATEIGVANPFDQAADVIDRITEQLETVPLYGDLFPEIVNPFKVPLTQGIPETISNILPQQITGGFTGQQNVNTNQVQGITPNFDQLNLDQKINKSNNLDNFIKS
tara:strand:- start:50 stop:4417 length:4368 start_codon:yes stop_codon:yes gene_type:complete